MPSKKSSNTKSAAKTPKASKNLQIFSENSQLLQLIIVAFITLSSLLVLHLVTQQKELDFYKKTQAEVLGK